MRLNLEEKVADEFGVRLAEFWRRHYRLEDRGRPGWVSVAELKRAIFECDFDNGVGTTIDAPTVLRGSPTPVVTEFAEQAFLWWLLGIEGRDWHLDDRQSQHIDSENVDLDLVLVTLADGSKSQFYFDVSKTRGCCPGS